ncbi:MAG: hypothetical protein DHS20C17_35430 [Cyclobacteriaceae bacterium]|nr:MAG: hypothetical protein DHS20C17_35430 [Cyclobacteriaceae bacterium]
MKTYLVCWLLLILSTACHQDDFCCVDPNNEIIDSWILFERGWSPGSGYNIDPVSADPPQTMEIRSNGRFTSNIQGLEKYQYFAIIQDQQWEVLALFENRPPENPQLDKLEHSYIIEFQENGTVRLYFRFCIEGCHLGLRKLN